MFFENRAGAALVLSLFSDTSSNDPFCGMGSLATRLCRCEQLQSHRAMYSPGRPADIGRGAGSDAGNRAVPNEGPPGAASPVTPVFNCAIGSYRPEKSSPPRTARPSRLIWIAAHRLGTDRAKMPAWRSVEALGGSPSCSPEGSVPIRVKSFAAGALMRSRRVPSTAGNREPDERPVVRLVGRPPISHSVQSRALPFLPARHISHSPGVLREKSKARSQLWSCRLSSARACGSGCTGSRCFGPSFWSRSPLDVNRPRTHGQTLALSSACKFCAADGRIGFALCPSS
jgi:hypothetical protein